MALIGEILYKWKGETKELEKASKKADKILEESEKKTSAFGKALKAIGVVAGGAAAAGLLEYYGVFGKLGKAMGSSVGILGKLGAGLSAVGAFAMKAVSPIGNLLKSFGALMATSSFLGIPFDKIIKRLKVSFASLVAIVSGLPAKIGAGLASLGSKLHAVLGPLGQGALTVSHVLHVLHDSVFSLIGPNNPLGRLAAGFFAVGTVSKGLASALEWLGLPVEKITTALASMSAATFGVLAAMALFINRMGKWAETLGSKVLAKMKDWVQESGQMQRSIWGLGVALEGYRKRIGETSLSLEDFTEKTQQLSIESGISMETLHQGVLQMMDLARVTGLTADQIYVLLGRLADFSTVTHTDFMTTVYAVDQAFRGYWRSLSSLGIQLDDTALANSAFGKGLDDTKQGIANAATATAKMNFLMHELEFVSGKAADSVSKTLPDAIRYSESAFSNLHMKMTTAMANVWTQYYYAVGKVGSALYQLPQPILQAAGAVTTLSGLFLVGIGKLVKYGSAVVAFMAIWKLLVAVLTKPLPITFLEKLGLEKLLGGKSIKTVTLQLVGLKNTTDTVTGAFKQFAIMSGTMLVNALASLLEMVRKVGTAFWGAFITPFKTGILIMAGVAVAIGLITYAIHRWINASKIAIKHHEEAVEGYSLEIERLESLKSTLLDITKSEEEKSLALSDAVDMHDELSEAVKREKENTDKLIPTVDRLINKYQTLADEERKRLKEELTNRRDELKAKYKSLKSDEEIHQKAADFGKKMQKLSPFGSDRWKKFKQEQVGLEASLTQGIESSQGKFYSFWNIFTKWQTNWRKEFTANAQEVLNEIDQLEKRLKSMEEQDLGFGVLKRRSQELLDIFESGMLGSSAELEKQPKLFMDAWKSAIVDYEDLTKAWESNSKTVIDSLTGLVKAEYQTKEELRKAIIEQEKIVASMYPRMADIINQFVEHDMERARKAFESFSDVFAESLESMSLDIEPKIDFSGLRDDIDWFDSYFKDYMQNETSKIQALGNATQEQFEVQLEAARLYSIEKLKLENERYEKEAALTRDFKILNVDKRDALIAEEKEAQDIILKTIDDANKAKFLKQVEAANKLIDLERDREEKVAKFLSEPEAKRKDLSSLQEHNKALKEIDKEIKRIKGEELKELSTSPSLKKRVDDYARYTRQIKELEEKKNEALKHFGDLKAIDEKKRGENLLEIDKELLEKKRQLYRQNLQDNENLYKDLVSMANQATDRIISIELEIKNKRIEYNRLVKDSARDLSETIAEFHREDVERLQDYGKILADIQGKEYYKGEFLARARDLTVFRDRLKEAVDLMRSASTIETSTGRPDWQKRIETAQGAVGALKGLMGGLTMPQIGEEPIKPWEGRSGTHTLEEEAAYKEQLRAYEEEKRIVEKQQEDIRKIREEVLNWYKRAVQELADIQKKAHEEEISRLEQEKDKWTETAETIKAKMEEVKKEIDSVREALMGMKLNIDNSQAKEAIDEVKGWLEELYAMANNVITLTVKSSKGGGLTPAFEAAKTGTAERIMRSNITGERINQEGAYQTGPKAYANVAAPETIQRVGNTYMNTGGASGGKEGGIYAGLVPVLDTIKKVGDTWMNVAREVEVPAIATPRTGGGNTINSSEQRTFNVTLNNNQANASPKVRELLNDLAVELEREQRRQ